MLQFSKDLKKQKETEVCKSECKNDERLLKKRN